MHHIPSPPPPDEEATLPLPLPLVSLPWHGLHVHGKAPATQTLERLLERLSQVARSAHNYAVLNLIMAYAPTQTYRVGRSIYQTDTYSIGQVFISNEEQLVQVLRQADSLVHLILLDIDRRRLFGPQMPAATAKSLLQRARLLTYSDGRTWAEALKDQLARLLDEDLQGKRIVIVGNDARSRSLVPKLGDFGAQITILMREEETHNAPDLASLSTEPSAFVEYLPLEDIAFYAERADAVVVWRDQPEAALEALAQHIRPSAFLMDAGLRSIPPQLLQLAHQRGALPVRVNLIPTLLGVLVAAHEHAVKRDLGFGWADMGGVKVVAGGAICAEGAVVVDHIRQPTRVLGVADGWGGIRTDYRPHEDQAVLRVQQVIARLNGDGED